MIPVGKSSFMLDTDDPGKRINVWVYRATSSGPDAGLVFVLHGADRNGEEYRDFWISLAERLGIVVAAPEFSVASFGQVHGYNLGNISDINGVRNEKRDWSFYI